ncbi:uncharacterized protein ARMOST_17972 [Armillaria ostoyae]|uniref:F-box domain-containing protein n=1 Tax=Armillaria ostoyae TaxID=47428 RepID=A0A284S0I0_ARMOS|nr:uncharacterized protein ARMOST_17972 [Armillaria ostoyae]
MDAGFEGVSGASLVCVLAQGPNQERYNVDMYSWPSTTLCKKCGRRLPSKNPSLSSSKLFHGKLRDGRSPLASEICAIISVRSHVVNEIDAYNAEILQLWQSLLKLQRYRDRLRVYAEHLDALLSPVRRLPYGISLQIFDRVRKETPCIRPPVMTLRLGLVCKRWGDITLDSPSLWSNIIRRLFQGIDGHASGSQRTEYSGREDSYLQSRHGSASPCAAGSMLSENALAVTVPSSLLDAVEHLTITEGSAHVGTLDLPKLQSLTILDLIPLAGAILPQNIHTLDLVFRSRAFDAVIYNLSRMRSLRHLTLESRDFRGYANTNHLPVHLARLTSLTCLNLRLGDDISRLLASVCVPSLTHLTIIGGNLQLDFLKSLLEQSNSPLQRLEILINVVSFAAVDLPTLISILRIVPGLTTLVIHEQKENVLLSKTLFSELAFGGDHDSLLPKLEHLELASSAPWVDIGDAIIQCIRSRNASDTDYCGRESDTPLKSAVLKRPLLRPRIWQAKPTMGGCAGFIFRVNV